MFLAKCDVLRATSTCIFSQPAPGCLGTKHRTHKEQCPLSQRRVFSLTKNSVLLLKEQHFLHQRIVSSKKRSIFLGLKTCSVVLQEAILSEVGKDFTRILSRCSLKQCTQNLLDCSFIIKADQIIFKPFRFTAKCVTNSLATFHISSVSACVIEERNRKITCHNSVCMCLFVLTCVFALMCAFASNIS